jgi:DAK2 domain fusion protein YloV
VTRRSCDGDGLLAALRAAVDNLERHMDEINDLNVFPVPDGDTGSNMVATVRVALAEAEAAAGGTAAEIATAIKRGALHGARGNSGVITSQIFGGMAEALGGKKRFNGLDLAFALRKGVERSYQAVKEPVEGTILTVIREAAEAAIAAAERDPDLETVLAATVDAAEKSVARTPSLLPILREAGVVDSGGEGLFRLFQGALMHLAGQAPAADARPGTAPRLALVVAGADEGHGYETVFFVRPASRRRLDLDALRDHLGEIGESVIVAGDGTEAKVHIHNERPDQVIAYGLSIGTLTDISVVNLDHQTADVRDRRVRELVRPLGDAHAPEEGSAPGLPAAGRARESGLPPISSTPPSIWIDPRARNGATMPMAIVAVASGDGLEKEFRDRGVSAIVRGGQTANPSTGELLAAIDRLNATEVVILPNNKNVMLAARQVVELATKPIHVVPTRNAVEGLEAVLAVNPALAVADNVARMTEQSRSVQTLQVTTATRDAKVSGRRVKRGQTIVLDPDEGLVAVHRERTAAILTALATLRPGFELVNLLYGEGADLPEAEAVAARVLEAFPGIEVDVARGGQPLYPFLIAVW